MPLEALGGATVKMGVVQNDVTPTLISTYTLRKYGMVLDYSCDRVYSRVLGREIPVIKRPNGHLCLSLRPPNPVI